MNEARSLVLSYLGLRRAVGYIGIGLPFVLLFGKLLVQGGPLPGSISAYYYSDMRNVLVGALCAVAIFLISYRPKPGRAPAGEGTRRRAPPGVLAGVGRDRRLRGVLADHGRFDPAGPVAAHAQKSRSTTYAVVPVPPTQP